MAFRASLVGEILAMDRNDLNRVTEVVASRRAQLDEAVKLQYAKGDRVTFVPSKGRYRGKRVTGPILKVMRKNLRVRDENTGVQWTVYPGFVESV